MPNWHFGERRRPLAHHRRPKFDDATDVGGGYVFSSASVDHRRTENEQQASGAVHKHYVFSRMRPFAALRRTIRSGTCSTTAICSSNGTNSTINSVRADSPQSTDVVSSTGRRSPGGAETNPYVREKIVQLRLFWFKSVHDRQRNRVANSISPDGTANARDVNGPTMESLALPLRFLPT
ncbi:hypothetical protein MMF83_00028405 [Klebsiella pneumoniae]